MDEFRTDGFEKTAFRRNVNAAYTESILVDRIGKLRDPYRIKRRQIVGKSDLEGNFDGGRDR